MNRLVCVADFKNAAREVLGKNEWEFLIAGSDDEITSNGSSAAYARWLIRPRMLRDVSQRDVSTTVLGKKLPIPFGVCPMGFQRTLHPDGEVASARAIAAFGGIFTLSLYSTSSIEEIGAATPNGSNWLQVFMHKDPEVIRKLVKRAENAGFEAIVLTVDAQYVGKRRPTRRNKFKFPAHLRLHNVLPDTSSTALNFDNLHSEFDCALSWDNVKFLKSITKLPIVVKGILTAEDAQLCVSYGADALIVSNHGGRQLDTVEATIDVLPDIISAVDGQCEVYIDSGITRGSDIFKVLALGAKMAFVGRSILYGVSVNGECGGKKIVQILKDELDLTMALSGVSCIPEITRDYVINNGNYLCKL